MPFPDQSTNAMNELTAVMSLIQEVRQIKGMASRLKGLVRRLEKFNFPLVAQPLAGLLTRPENHTATARFEALIHLAALTCHGTLAPTQRQLREWLNVILLQDSITEIEDPVEDVFVSNVATRFGNARLFQGGWRDNDHYVQTCLAALSRVMDRTWATAAQRHVIAMLHISEAIAERACVIRNTLTESQPRQPVKISSSIVNSSADHVIFSEADIFEMGISPGDLNPFIFQSEHAAVLAEETLGHTTLERHPLVRLNGQTIVALPTAIGAGIRRFVIEQASKAGDLQALQSTISDEQFGNIYSLGCRGWDIESTDAPELIGPEGMIDFVGTFDEGGYVHLIYVPDDLAETTQEGLQGVHSVMDMIDEHLDERAAELADKPDYRRGLTLLVHGGIGRGYLASFGKPLPGWHSLSLPISDFMLLGGEFEFTALRAWKLLEQEAVLQQRDVFILNMGGFLNLCAYGYEQDFELVPESMELGLIRLHTDFIAPLRHRLRVALDQHVIIAPDKKSWVEVERETPNAFFHEKQKQPVFISPHHAIGGELLACVETSTRPWWVHCDELPESRWHRRLAGEIWKVALQWLIPLAPLLEERLTTLSSAPVTYRLRFPDIGRFADDFAFAKEPNSAPSVEICEGKVLIGCSPDYLRSFLNRQNVGDRLMCAALVRGAYTLCGAPAPGEVLLHEFVQDVVRSDDACFFRLVPSRTVGEIIYDAVPLPKPRFQSAEDSAWSRLDLARKAGWTSPPGPIPESQAREILMRAVDAVWERIKARLLTLDRVSVIERTLLNFETIQKDRMAWHRAAAALLAMHDNTSEVIQVANKRYTQRDFAGLASRMIAEMALCTSPCRGGGVCTGADLDFLIAEVGTLLECAGQSDAMRYGIATHPPIVHANGSFGFDLSIAEMLTSFFEAHSERTFQEAADDYGSAFVGEVEGKAIDTDFDAAFTTEFGLSIDQYSEFVGSLTEKALEQRTAHFWLPRSKVVRRLRELGVPHPKHTLGMFTLAPRPKWDEDEPEQANKRDWYPWRYNRHLSIMRRPLVQISTKKDPDVLIMPTLLDRMLRYLGMAESGDFPGDFFDSDEMRSWIGRVADRNGHAFNRSVAERLNELHWEVRSEVKLTLLGGGTELGDIDVLAWRPKTGLVYAIECKRLLFDRTIGEIGERLAEYTTVSDAGVRTPIQRHLDRISYLKSSLNQLAQLTTIPVERLQLRSVLVTDKLVPMQFSKRALQMLDLVTDYALLEEAFGIGNGGDAPADACVSPLRGFLLK